MSKNTDRAREWLRQRADAHWRCLTAGPEAWVATHQESIDTLAALLDDVERETAERIGSMPRRRA